MTNLPLQQSKASRRLLTFMLTGILIFSLLSLACSFNRLTQNETPTPTQIPTASLPALGTPSTNPAVTTESGLIYQDIVTGNGEEAVEGSTLTVHYTLWLEDGTEIDSSYDYGEPFSLTLGRRMVIPGWEEGLLGMKVGGVRKLVIPPNLGYGSQDNGPIPANSTLIFDVELISIP